MDDKLFIKMLYILTPTTDCLFQGDRSGLYIFKGKYCISCHFFDITSVLVNAKVCKRSKSYNARTSLFEELQFTSK